MKVLKMILCLIALCLVCAVVLFKCNNPFKKKIAAIRQEKAIKKDEKEVSQISVAINDTATFVKDTKTGITHTIKKTVVGNNNQLNIFLKKALDSIAKENGILRKQLDNYTEEKIHASGSFTDQPLTKISNQLWSFETEDCSLDGFGIVNDSLKTVNYYYTFDVKLKDVRYWKRPHQILWGFIKYGFPVFEDNYSTNCENVIIDSAIDISIRKKH